jgi:hypothetical protein
MPFLPFSLFLYFLLILSSNTPMRFFPADFGMHRAQLQNPGTNRHSTSDQLLPLTMNDIVLKVLEQQGQL